MWGFDSAVGLAVGALFGAALGAVLVALVGAALGGAAGLLLGRLVPRVNRQFIAGTFSIGHIGMACGVVAEAFYFNAQAAIAGLCYGSLIGIGGAVLFYLAVGVLHYFLFKHAVKLAFWRIKS